MRSQKAYLYNLIFWYLQIKNAVLRGENVHKIEHFFECKTSSDFLDPNWTDTDNATIKHRKWFDLNELTGLNVVPDFIKTIQTCYFKSVFTG